MTDETSKKPPVVTELIPSQAGGVSALASANAPIIFFDEVAGVGHYNGICHLTLNAMRFMAVGSDVRQDATVVAHLRMNWHALAALKDAITKIELLAKPPASSEKN